MLDDLLLAKHEMPGEYLLLAAICRISLYDAQRGNRQARRFLDDVCPRWRDLLAENANNREKQRRTGVKHTG